MEDNIIYVEEIGSSNGTWINSEKLITGQKVTCQNTDVIRLGNSNSSITLRIENLSIQKDQKDLPSQIGPHDTHDTHDILEKAHNEAKMILQKARLKAEEFEKQERDRISALHDEYQFSKIKNKQEMAHAASLAVHEFLTIEMIKQRNLILNEKLIKKIAERARILVVEASLGRIHASENGLKPFPTKDYRKLFKIFFYLLGGIAFIFLLLYLWTLFPKEIQAALSMIEKFLADNNLSLSELPTIDQIFEKFR